MKIDLRIIYYYIIIIIIIILTLDNRIHKSELLELAKGPGQYSKYQRISPNVNKINIYFFEIHKSIRLSQKWKSQKKIK